MHEKPIVQTDAEVEITLRITESIEKLFPESQKKEACRSVKADNFETREVYLKCSQNQGHYCKYNT